MGVAGPAPGGQSTGPRGSVLATTLERLPPCQPAHAAEGDGEGPLAEEAGCDQGFPAPALPTTSGFFFDCESKEGYTVSTNFRSSGKELTDPWELTSNDSSSFQRTALPALAEAGCCSCETSPRLHESEAAASQEVYAVGRRGSRVSRASRNSRTSRSSVGSSGTKEERWSVSSTLDAPTSKANMQQLKAALFSERSSVAYRHNISEPAGPRNSGATIDQWNSESRKSGNGLPWDTGSNVSRSSFARRVLSTKVESWILRAIPAVTLFRSFGAAFSNHDYEEDNYRQSSEANWLDDFVSHDWASLRSDKFLTLCMIYNGWPAALVSLGCGIVLVILQMQGILPTFPAPEELTDMGQVYGVWCELICPIVFFVVFFWWQQLLNLLAPYLPRVRCRQLFLDKYCIDQVDEQRKQAGILGLAGFLKKTDRFVVCWTPRYFTRLWCTYEVATWLFLKKPLESVLFMPLSHGKAMVLFCIFFTLYNLMFGGMLIFLEGGGVYIFVGMLVGSLTCPWPVHKLRHFVHDVRQLPEQLSSFSIKKAECYCCKHNHVHPDDPSIVLPCDRLLVEQTVGSWFSKDLAKDSTDDTLQAFDDKVRDLFGEFVLKRAGPAQLPYQYVVLFTWSFVFRGLDSLLALKSSWPKDAVLRAFIEYWVVILVTCPSGMKLTFLLVTFCDRKFGMRKRIWADVLQSVATTTVVWFIFIFLWLAVTSANAFKPVLPFIVVSTLEIIFALFLFQDEFKRLLAHVRAAVQSAAKADAAAPVPLEDVKVSSFGNIICRTRRVEI